MSGSTTMTMMTNIRTTGANDDSNPQQGGVSSPSQQATTVSHQQGTTRRGPNSGTSKPPSSKKDERKLFVGGLPSNGKYSNNFCFTSQPNCDVVNSPLYHLFLFFP